MLTQTKFLLTLAIETEDLSLAENSIHAIKNTGPDVEELEILILSCLEELPQKKEIFQIEGAGFLWDNSKVRLWNRAARYAQGRFISFIKAGEEFLPDSLLKILETLKTLDPDGIRLSPIDQKQPPDSKKAGRDYTKDSVSKVDLRVRYAAQPYSLRGLFFKTELLKTTPFEECLGEYAAHPWLIKTFQKSSSYYILEDACFTQSPETKPAIPKIRVNDFFNKYVWEPYRSCENKEGVVPLYVQVSILRNIGRFLLLPDDKVFEKDVLSFLPFISEKAVHKAPGINAFQRRYLLYKRSFLLGKKCPDKLLELDSLPVYIDSLAIKENCITIEGFAVCLCFQEVTDFYAEAEGQRHKPVRVNRDSHNQNLFGKPLSRAYGFCFKLPVARKEGKISFFVTEKAGGTYRRKNLHFRMTCCLADGWGSSYSIQDHRILSFHEGSLLYEDYRLCTHIKREWSLFRSLWENSDATLRQAALIRLECHIVRLFCKRKIWLISDKTFRGDDNGEALFLWLCKEHPRDIRPVFVLEEESPDFARLSQIGEVVPYLSRKHLRLLLLCTCNIGAYAPKSLRYPHLLPIPAFSDFLARPRQIFLQHGITHNDVSNSIGKYVKGFHLITCSSVREQEAFLKGNYHYDREQLPITGMARYDRLYSDTRKIITFAPTWRNGLVGDPDVNDIRPLTNSFYTSNFRKNVIGLLSHPRLLEAAQALGYTIQFVPHTVFLPHLEEFHLDQRILVPGSAVCYRDVFAQSSLLITDYSSVAFDFAFLNKPVIYFQFDQREFFRGDHYQQGYFDYKEDGFGEVEEDLESMVSLVISYMETGCIMKEIYQNRCANFFAYQDRENCKRIFQEIYNISDDCF